jgi:hypothetical protein
MKAIDLQPLEYWITRGGDAGTTTEVPETAELQPGDVLDVRYNVSNNLDGAMLSSVDPTQSQ